MRYAEINPGMHIIRTRELTWARKLSGVICLVKPGPSDGRLYIQLTRDCVPVGSVLAVPPEGDDGYWYNVSDLVMEANSAILPNDGTSAYSCPVEANYRNFVGCDGVRPYIGEDAMGQLCLIGEKQRTGRLVFSKTGYYVVGVDINGYAAAYQGFCEYVGEDNPRKPALRILNLSNTERAFYPAGVVVDACHSAFDEDCGLAEQYRQDIKQSIVDTSTESEVSEMLLSDVNRLQLEAVP